MGLKKHKTTFEILLTLHTHTDVISELEQSYDADPDPTLHLIPQLLTFLLYGGYIDKEKELEDYLLSLCARDIIFAHRVFWFLRAWQHQESLYSSLSTSSTRRTSITNLQPDEIASIGRLMKNVMRRGEGPASLLMVGQVSRALLRSRIALSGRSFSGAPLFTPYLAIFVAFAHTVYVFRQGPSEDSSLHNHSSSYASSTQYYQHSSYTPSSPLPSSTPFSPSKDPSLLPQTPANEPNPRHLASVKASHRIGFFPVSSLSSDPNNSNVFFATPRFMDALIEVADKLFPLPKEARTAALRELLRDLELEMLPSNVVYSPVGGSKHRVWRIVADESLAISTKERVPCIVTLEVVEYGAQDGGASTLATWWKQKRHPQRHNNHIIDKFQMLATRMSSMSRAFEDKFMSPAGGDEENEEEGEGAGDLGALPPHRTDSDFSELTGESGGGALQRTDSQVNLAVMGQWTSPTPDRKSKSRTFSESDVDNSQGKAARTVRDKDSVIFKEAWDEKENRIRPTSSWGHLPGWKLVPVFVKSNDDLRQEQLASQLIKQMAIILSDAKIPVWLYPYDIIAISDRAGIIEGVADSISIDSLKRNYRNYTTLKGFFEDYFGAAGSDGFEGAKANFVESLAAYSIACYILQVRR